MLSRKHLDIRLLHDAEPLPPFSTLVHLKGRYEAKLASH